MNVPFHVDPRAAADAGSELAIQSRFRSRMKMLAPKVRLVAVPNGGQRTAWAAMKAKQEGMSAGFWDLIALAPDGKVAFVEFKAKDGRLSEAQADWGCWMHQAGFPCGVFNNAFSAMRFLHESGFPFLCKAEALAA